MVRNREADMRVAILVLMFFLSSVASASVNPNLGPSDLAAPPYVIRVSAVVCDYEEVAVRLYRKAANGFIDEFRDLLENEVDAGHCFIAMVKMSVSLVRSCRSKFGDWCGRIPLHSEGITYFGVVLPAHLSE